MPDHLEPGHVEFARQLACRAMAYAVEVERRYRGLAPAASRRRAGDGMTVVKTSATIRLHADGSESRVEPFYPADRQDALHRCCHVYEDQAPILANHR